jgi:transcriptional regulator with XRE-family HTH domain
MVISADQVQQIPKADLEEMWFAFQHRLLGELQSAARSLRAKGITQDHIAARIGAEPSQVSRWLRGRNMTTKTMHNLARGMECRLDVALRPLASIQPANNQPAYISPFADIATGPGTSLNANAATNFTNVVEVSVSGGANG